MRLLTALTAAAATFGFFATAASAHHSVDEHLQPKTLELSASTLTV